MDRARQLMQMSLTKISYVQGPTVVECSSTSLNSLRAVSCKNVLYFTLIKTEHCEGFIWGSTITFHCDAFKEFNISSYFSLFFPDQAANVQKKLVNLQIPLFLRFLNLLINDSIFLLDEALQVLFLNVGFQQPFLFF